MSHCNQNLNLLNPLPVVKDWILFECGAVAVGLQALLSLPGPTLLLPLLSLSPKIDFNCPVLHNTYAHTTKSYHFGSHQQHQSTDSLRN